MCSISGFLRFDLSKHMSQERIIDIMRKGEARGRDSFGYVIFNSESKKGRIFRHTGKASDILKDGYGMG